MMDSQPTKVIEFDDGGTFVTTGSLMIKRDGHEVKRELEVPPEMIDEVKDNLFKPSKKKNLLTKLAKHKK